MAAIEDNSMDTGYLTGSSTNTDTNQKQNQCNTGRSTLDTGYDSDTDINDEGDEPMTKEHAFNILAALATVAWESGVAAVTKVIDTWIESIEVTHKMELRL